VPTGHYKRTPPSERLLSKITIVKSGCWEFLGYRTRDGYGQISVNGKPVLAHRFSWEYHNSKKIPEGLVIDHLCRNPSCVNPKHLECVTMLVNTERGVLYQTLTTNAKNKTFCKRGHDLFGSNLKIDHRGDRMCKTCQAMKGKEWKENNRERVNEQQRKRRLRRLK